jgi:hypothetical protein
MLRRALIHAGSAECPLLRRTGLTPLRKISLPVRVISAAAAGVPVSKVAASEAQTGAGPCAPKAARGTSRSMAVERRALLRFMTLYAALFSAFGFASPFLPAFLAGRGSNAARLIRCDLADHRPKLARSEPIEIVLAFSSLSGGLS